MADPENFVSGEVQVRGIADTVGGARMAAANGWDMEPYFDAIDKQLDLGPVCG